jgi:hypothetical protein
VGVAARNEQVAIGKRNYFMRVAGDGNPAEDFAFTIELDNLALALEADEVVAVLRLAGATELVVRGHGGFEFDLPGDLAVATHFDDPAGTTLNDEHTAIGQGWQPSTSTFSGALYSQAIFLSGVISTAPKWWANR